MYEVPGQRDVIYVAPGKGTLYYYYYGPRGRDFISVVPITGDLVYMVPSTQKFMHEAHGQWDLIYVVPGTGTLHTWSAAQGPYIRGPRDRALINVAPMTGHLM